MSQPKNEKPIIEYPCPWDFKVIGQDEETVRVAILECVADCLHDVDPGRPVKFGSVRLSGGGKYTSLGMTVLVDDEIQRNTIFRALADRPEIKMVI